MSRLNELIQEFCPNGVEYKRVNEIADTFIGLATTVTKNKTSTGIQLLHNSDIQPNKIIIKKYEYVTPEFVEKNQRKIWRKNDIVTVHTGDVGTSAVVNKEYDGCIGFATISTRLYDLSKTLPKYICYFFNSHLFKRAITPDILGDRKNLNLASFNKMVVPIPPIEVQREIVRILDTFVELIDKLNEELVARKKQYVYYRNELLTFDNKVKRLDLGSIIKKSSSGATPSKKNNNYYENGTIPWLRTQDVKFNSIYQINSYITELALKETAVKYIPENCVIVAISGATAGRCAINKIKTTTNQHCLNLEIDATKALYKYVFYCISNQYNELIAKKQGARGDLNSSLILSLKIPIPSLEEQSRIVSILDKFDTLCNDQEKGIPAEIALRQKQYEYYRDKLLTFKELER